MRIKSKFLALGCIAAAAGMLMSGVACNEHEIEPFSQSLVAGTKQLQGSGDARAVDIVFVIDNSSSMQAEQDGLDKNFSKFIAKLIDAGADFRIGVVTTSDKYVDTNMAMFSTDAVFGEGQSFWSRLKDQEGLSQSELDVKMADVKELCDQYFASDGHSWISSSDVSSYVSDKMDKPEVVKNLFRCAAMAGTSGDGIERGLSTMWKSLSTYLGTGVTDKNRFKRPGSILSIVFVTDENDCSDSYFEGDHSVLATLNVDGSKETATGNNVINGNKQTARCENERNIEDSCTITSRDTVAYSTDKGSLIVSATGQDITYQDEKHALREWCVDGSEKAREALCKCRLEYLQDVESNAEVNRCPAGANINYGGKTYAEVSEKCDPETYKIKPGTKQLVSRNYYYEKVLNYVIDSNRVSYQANRADLAQMTPGDFKREVRKLAQADVIIASIINRDAGQRYDGVFPENWCGAAGNQSYRYQLFAEMFNNNPIYAPICCKNEPFTAAVKSDASETEIKEARVCEAGANGDNADFGPVLGAIGQRIGEAVNTICTESAPVTCNISDCNEEKAGGGFDETKPRKNPGVACPCNRGCNGSVTYFANSDREYNLCNEFHVTIQSVPKNEPMTEANTNTLEENTDYKIEYESNYCYTRTGSPIQVNMIRTDANSTLAIGYPKKTVGN